MVQLTFRVEHYGRTPPKRTPRHAGFDEMDFEHIIEINDPRRPYLPRLSAAQLWRGLLLRVRRPEWFLDVLESATVAEVAPGLYERELRYGGFAVRDRVQVGEDLRIEVRVESPAHLRGMALQIQPEAPEPQVLIVRFLYTTRDAPDDDLTPAERRAREAAWLNADRDAIALIRRMAATGELGD